MDIIPPENLTKSETREQATKNESGPITLPVAILVAGVIVSFSIIYAFSGNGTANNNLANSQKPAVQYGTEKRDIDNLKPVSSSDRILGNPNAPVKIIEYSDFECPFCKNFHITMKQVMDKYGKTGQVAWVYRHFPLLSIHPKSLAESDAAECAFDLGGITKFWEFTDKIFAITPANNQLDYTLLLKTAGEIGLDKSKFAECQKLQKHFSAIQASIDEGLAAGVRGTPYSVVIAPNGNKHEINGALNFSAVESLINIALKETAPAK